MKKAIYVIGLCIAFAALLSLASCNKPANSESGDSGIIGTWKMEKVTDLEGNRQDDGTSEVTLTFDAKGYLYAKTTMGSQAYDFPPVRWTRNGDVISFEEGALGDVKSFTILKNTAKELNLQAHHGDPFDLIYYMTRVR